MRGITAISSSILLSIALAPIAVAEGVPDLGPLNCAWDKLPAEEQARLKEEFKIDLGGGFTLHFGTANPSLVNEAARACQLALAPPQLENLGHGLARRAAEERAKKGITDKGEKPESIQTALAKMHEGKRVLIGDTFACPGPHPSVSEWDKSVSSAVNKANLRFKDQRAMAWVSLGLYAVMAEEGAVRRMNGQADACS